MESENAMTASILFVCLGNICRSPLAEGVFSRLAADAGIAVRVDSAGTGDWHIGHPPDPRAQAEVLRNGIDISRLRARQVIVDDFRDFDHIVAMDRNNHADLVAMRPHNGTAALSRLLDHAAVGVGDVPDPYYGGDAGFAETFRLVEAGARGLLAQLAKRKRSTIE
jgi:protein-tyrosine phosphatase